MECMATLFVFCCSTFVKMLVCSQIAFYNLEHKAIKVLYRNQLILFFKNKTTYLAFGVVCIKGHQGKERK